MDYGQAIRREREKLGYNQSEFSSVIGITQSYLSQIENGHRKPSTDLLELISERTGTPMVIMFWGSLTEADIEKKKLAAFRIMKPSIDAMIETFF